MAERWDAIVVGGGAMGTSTARHLASRGWNTLLLERFRIGHPNGSSHGPNRIFRLAYHHPDYVRMARLALAEWRVLEDEAGERLLETTGGLDTGIGAPIAAEALKFGGEPFEWIDAEAARERWPALSPPEGPLLFQADAGVCHADATVAAQARLARSLGATILEETPVQAVVPTADDRIEVTTAEGGVHSAPRVVVTAGAWARPLLARAGLDVPLRVTRELAGYAQLPDASALPTLIEWRPEPFPSRYALPVPARPGLVKLGEHRAGATIDPDDPPSDDPDRDDALAGYARERFPEAAPAHREPCLYTNTADEDFVLDRIGPVVIGSPCSGHGFKFTPLIGRILADLAAGAPPPVPLDRFAWDRPSLRAGRP